MLGLADLFEPIKGSIVDCLSNVKAEIEASMIRSSKDEHELILLMFCLGNSQFWVFAFEIIWIDEGGLMSEKLLT